MQASSGTVRTQGNAAYATVATAKLTVMSGHSRMRRWIHGSTRRTTKVAAAKLPRMSPMVVAESPMELP